MDEAKSYLAALKGGFREKDIQVKTIVEKGTAVKWISDVAESENVDLITMASYSRTGLECVFFDGIMAAGVLHKVEQPWLLVRADNTK